MCDLSVQSCLLWLCYNITVFHKHIWRLQLASTLCQRVRVHAQHVINTPFIPFTGSLLTGPGGPGGPLSPWKHTHTKHEAHQGPQSNKSIQNQFFILRWLTQTKHSTTWWRAFQVRWLNRRYELSLRVWGSWGRRQVHQAAMLPD